MPSQAISPALPGLLDLTSGPMLLIYNSPAEECERRCIQAGVARGGMNKSVRKETFMQYVDHSNETVEQFWRMEHYRFHCAEQWPDSPYKQAVLATVHSALERLETATVEPFERPLCMVSAARKRKARVIMFPAGPKASPAVFRPAA